ncbi:response regulator transcription factor [Chromatocurvus halotolerans]|uniref:Two-component system response regulator PhoP n=1 Tax=Chromatocurvus halotolerans TaxID=1132028 RepID=A0A4R2L2C3_9GAMM|nr:response regulator transcription factor [Chromatocurvus halotolerans]TCO76708.1 two-component system response regulator PhoP [Chromatocurvus halotolerans]
MRMLLVEDDDRLRTRLADHFRGNGWAVEEAETVRDADFMAHEVPCDVAIADLGLPDGSGVRLISGWRAAGIDFPVMILTARADWRDKVEGLEAGADDYVTKPFYLEEVEARVQALLRRAVGRRTAAVSYGALAIDFSARQVTLEGRTVELTAFEYNTLAYLAHRADAVVSRSELVEHLYEQDHDRDSNVIEVFVGRLRRKLDPDGALQPIQTVRGAGYRFTLEPSAP